SLVNIGNTTLGDKSIFGGQDFLGPVFKNVGSDIIFRGNNDSFNVNVFASETIKANITADEAFGAMATRLVSENNLNARLSDLELSTSIEMGTLVLKEGSQRASSSITVNIAAGDDLDDVVNAINAVANVALATALNTAISLAEDVFEAAGGPAGLAAAVNAVLTTEDNSTSLRALIEQEAQTLILAANPLLNAGNLPSSQKAQIEAAGLAARNSLAEREFVAVRTRGGLAITHRSGSMVQADEAASSVDTLADLELSGRNSETTYLYMGSLSGIVDGPGAVPSQTLSIAGSSGSLSVRIHDGDSLAVIARRINRAVNESNVSSDFAQLTASVTTDPVDGAQSLAISSKTAFTVSGVSQLVADTTMNTGGVAVALASIRGYHNRIEDLRGGIGLETGTVSIESLAAKFGSQITLRKGDSLDYILEQINNLAGFSASLDSSGERLTLQSSARYSYEISPNASAPQNFRLSDASGGNAVIVSMTGVSTLSEMAERIKAASTASLVLNAEVSEDSGSLIITSNERLNLTSSDPAANFTSVQMSDHSTSGIIEGSVLTGLGFAKGMDSAGKIEGRSILGHQIRLSDLNGGQGVRQGKVRINGTEIDLSSAVTLRDVKVLVETAMAGQVEVAVNDSGNGLALKSTGGSRLLVEEVGSGFTARNLGLIPAPANSVSGVDIQGSDLNPLLSRQTLLSELNGGNGMDRTGFKIINGKYETTVTFDMDSDGIDDIRTMQELVNHINQKSKQDGVFVTARFDATDNQIIIESQLSNTALHIEELAVGTSVPPVYGTTAADLGLLGSFSDSTLLSELNAGNGFDNGSFYIEYGTRLPQLFELEDITPPAAGNELVLYNENGSLAITADDTNATIADLINTINADQRFVISPKTAPVSNLLMLSASEKFSVVERDATSGTIVKSYNTRITNLNEIATPTEVVIDLEFAETLGQVKNAIESATNGALTVRYGKSDRLELISSDPEMIVNVRENGDSSDTAGSLGLVHNGAVNGKELRDGQSSILSSSTRLSELGLNLTVPAPTGSTENHLVIVTGSDTTSIDLSSATTVGDVLN
ncbi:MAG: hypothetical protein HQL31_03005, partial [Planctomycetes bacterium]|nr:hypothetical protein [Planctomycetota bacterium]